MVKGLEFREQLAVDDRPAGKDLPSEAGFHAIHCRHAPMTV